MISKLGCKTKGLYNTKGLISSFGSEGSLSWNKPTIIPDNEIWYTSTDGSTITPSGFQNIESNQYINNKGIIKFSDTVIKIPSFAFSNCSTLKSIVLPSNISTIELGAFENCINLASIKIPENTVSIFGGAFYGCLKLTEVKCSSYYAPLLITRTPGQEEDGGVVYGKSIFIPYVTQNDSVSYSVKARSASYYAIFYNDWKGCDMTLLWKGSSKCPVYFGDVDTGLNSATAIHVIYDESIPRGGSVTIPASDIADWELRVLDGYVYMRFNPVYAGTVTIYGSSSGSGTGIKSNSPVFENTNLRKVLYIPPLSSGYDEGTWLDFSEVKINTYDYGKINDSGTWIYNNNTLTLNYSNNMPDYTEESILPYKGYTSDKVVIDGNVNRIGNYAFYNCDLIKSFNIHNNITSIGNYAFYNCEGFLYLSIPVSVSTIGTEAFKNIPNIFYFGNKTIYSDYGHKLLNGFIETPFVYTNKNKTDLVRCWKHASGSISVQNGVTTITDEAFCNCFNITSITIPNSVTQIGTDVFKGCINLPIRNGMKYAGTCLVETTDKTLSTYNVESGTRFICNNAFENINLQETIQVGEYSEQTVSVRILITIPYSVEKIGNNAFLHSRTVELTLNRFYYNKLVDVVALEGSQGAAFYYNIIFNINSFDPNFNLSNMLDHGSGQKLTATYNIYTDLEQIAILAKNFNDEYTLVTPYYLNGTKWYPDPEPEAEQES